MELEFWISIVSGIPDSLSCISDSKAQDSRLHKQNFSRIPKTWFWPCNTLREKSDFAQLAQKDVSELYHSWPVWDSIWKVLYLNEKRTLHCVKQRSEKDLTPTVYREFLALCCGNHWDQFRFSKKLPTYPSPKPTFCPKWEVSDNVSLGEG